MKIICARLPGILFACLLSFHAFADESCHYKKFAEIPTQLKKRTLIIDGAVDDHATPIAIDTGAGTSYFTGKGAEKLGLDLVHSNISSIGVGGESTTYITTVNDLTLGPSHLHQRLHFLVIMQSADPSDFTLGADILFNQDMEISLAENKIKLFRPVACEETFLGYWGDNVSETPMMDISSKDARQFIYVELNGIKMRAIIDSGSKISLINLAAAARAGITPETPGVTPFHKVAGIGAHTNDSWVAPFDQLTIADETIKKPKIVITDLWGSALKDSNKIATSALLNNQPDILLGIDFLMSHRVLFARSQRILYFSYLGGSVFGPF